MRPTVTIDPDVEELLKERVRQTRQSFKQVLNNAIRQGLRGEGLPASRKRFRVQARPMGLQLGIDPARLAEIGDGLELDAFLEITRRLTRKSRR